jgi:uncharacterized surface protein with fasciclin (FAS1) repeats
LEGNDALTGSLDDAFCENPSFVVKPVIVADCDMCDPECCRVCCQKGEECNDGIHVPDLDPIWQLGYQRLFFTFKREDYFMKEKSEGQHPCDGFDIDSPEAFTVTELVGESVTIERHPCYNFASSTSGSHGSGGSTGTPSEDSTVWGVLRNHPSLNWFRQTLESVNLDKVLAETRVIFNVFAPSDEAAQSDERLQHYSGSISQWSGHLTYVLENHIINGKNWTREDIFADGTSSEAYTLTGENITMDSTEEMINGQTITGPDLMSVNGVVHIINGVFLPGWYSLNMAQVVEASDGFQERSLLDLMLYYSVLPDPALTSMSDNGTTLVAPIDAAFEGIDTDKSEFGDMLLYHIVDSRNLYGELLEQESQLLVSTRHPAGAQAWVTMDEAGVMRYNDVKVEGEALGWNG